MCDGNASSDAHKANALSVPELNSTLHVARRLRDLEQTEADASLLADERLAECPELRQQITDKALQQLNLEPDERQFCSLLPLDINESLLIEQVKAARPRPARVRAPLLDAPRPQLSDLLHLATHYEFPALPDAVDSRVDNERRADDTCASEMPPTCGVSGAALQFLLNHSQTRRPPEHWVPF